MKKAPSREPVSDESVHVRRVKGLNAWFIPNKALDNSTEQFSRGIMRDVTFNPKARRMTDVFCSTGNVSEADAVGRLQLDVGKMPGDALRVCPLKYDNVKKEFFDGKNREHVITKADYLLLQKDGTALVGWKT